MDAVRSPCTGQCRTDPSGEMCVACFRTVDEVMLWSAMTDAEKEFVLVMGQRRRDNWFSEKE